MKRERKTLFIAVVLVLCFVIGGLQEAAAGGGAQGKGKKPIVVNLMSKTTSPYSGILMKEYKEKASKLYPDIEWLAFDAQSDSTLQAQQADEAIAMNPAVILIHTIDSKALVGTAEKIHKAGIPLINFNSKLAPEAEPFYTTFYGPDCYLQGRAAADLLHEKYPSGCKYVYLGQDPSNETSRLRLAGFVDQAKEKGYNFTLLGESPPCDYQAEKGKTYMTAFLAKFPGQIDAVHAVDDSVGDGARQAIEEDVSGLNAKIQIVGYGGRKSALDGIREGKNWVGTIYQSPVSEMTSVMQVAADIIAGKMPPGKNMPMDMPKITRENVAQFEPAF
ncbi:MAG: sugar ABC transporter substrate-binding protein [Treponema sp.]|jgi:ABC-type sugar transport system substrate-binding protein|nr:sugar ABC transporter substrate-binding protein [Treponema sp.]